jgi:hypothetical protein
MAFQYEIADGVYVGTTVEADADTLEAVQHAVAIEDITPEEAAGALYGRILDADEVDTNFDLNPNDPGQGHEIGEPLGSTYEPPLQNS